MARRSKSNTLYKAARYYRTERNTTRENNHRKGDRGGARARAAEN